MRLPVRWSVSRVGPSVRLSATLSSKSKEINIVVGQYFWKSMFSSNSFGPSLVNSSICLSWVGKYQWKSMFLAYQSASHHLICFIFVTKRRIDKAPSSSSLLPSRRSSLLVAPSSLLFHPCLSFLLVAPFSPSLLVATSSSILPLPWSLLLPPCTFLLTPSSFRNYK